MLDPRALTPEVVVELLTGPLGGADTLGLRRLRQRLRARELAAGGTRRSDELLVELVAALDDPGDSDPADSDGPGVGDDPDDEGAARRVAGVLRAGQAALAGAEPGGGAEAVLWAMWSASGLGPVWRDRALAGGAAGQRADRDLDAVVALFEAAARFTDRLPHAKAEVFLDYLEGQDLPADTLAARAPSGDAVTLVTATGSAGLEWDVVAVPGVQEGTWPDLRLRSSLLGAQHLADLHDHGLPPDAQGQRRAVWDDELRLFLVAITRAPFFAMDSRRSTSTRCGTAKVT